MFCPSFRPKGRQDLGRRPGKSPSISSTETVPLLFPRKLAKREVRRRKKRSRKGWVHKSAPLPPPKKFNDWPTDQLSPCSEDSESKRLILNMHNTPKVLLPCNEILNLKKKKNLTVFYTCTKYVSKLYFFFQFEWRFYNLFINIWISFFKTIDYLIIGRN